MPCDEQNELLDLWRRRDGSAAQNGFTLIEVLVALVILSAAMAVVLSGLQTAEIGAFRTSDQAESLTIAKSLLAAEGTALPLRCGDTSGDTSDGYHWNVSIKPWMTDVAAGPLLMGAYWIGVQVAHAGHTVDLTTLRPGPAPNAS